jgi:signal transduction histidine kinase
MAGGAICMVIESHDHPLPARQYLGYVMFFHILTLGSLSVALVWTLSSVRTSLGGRGVVVACLLVAEIGLYVGLLAFGGGWPLSRRRLTIYFASSLGLWLVEYWLMPQLWWLNLAYLGQVFGLLSARVGLAIVAALVLAFLARNAFWNLEAAQIGNLVRVLAPWGAAVVFDVFMNHLIRTSSERGRLIGELEAAKRELEAAQQRETELAVLQERERVARDLHDSLGHALVALSVQLEATQRLYRVDPERASKQMDELKGLTRSSMDALRRSVAGLRAPGLGDRALRPALQTLCVEVGQRAGLEVNCQVEESVDQLSLVLAEALWRITQEALTNVEKHARARRVEISLKAEPRAVVLRIADDGVGLPQAANSSPDHFGLRGMRERVEGLGGTLEVRGGVDGTLLEARLPIITL